ncbi:MAG: N-acetylmuramoyl-L-alanine amidase [Elusimicrobiales bacterium]|nr:N-acetylmuramoyl-L-alanine amidase [Elusimicrobiales bacterium]
MNLTRVLCLLLLLSPAAAAGEISFVYPAEGAQLSSMQKTFVFGSVTPATAPFTINGEKVAVHSNGGFIAYLPVGEGEFFFKGQLSDGTTAQRSVKVRPAAETRSSTGPVRLEITNYASDSELFAGDVVRLAAYGTPGKEAVFSLGSLAEGPMTESPAGSGRYYAAYLLKPGDAGAEFTPAARFKAGLFGRGASARAKGRIRVMKVPLLVETSTDTVVLRNAPDGGYVMFLQKGVKLVTTARAGGMRRVRLSASEEAWVDEAKVQAATGAPYPFSPVTETGSIRLKKTDFGSAAVVGLYEKVPYSAEVLENGLRVRLYYTNLHTNWVVYDSSDALVKNVAFRQAGAETAELDFETAPGALWGYSVSYSTSARALQVELRSAPRPSLAWPRPLTGLTVVLDPGHSTHLRCGERKVPLRDVRFSSLPASAGCRLDGAVGPKETFEVNLNLAISQRLRDRLQALGAAVKLTRSGDEYVDLADRPKMARDLGGDLFISVHNNAIGDGEDPFSQPRGFSIYHYQRHSRALAAAIHRSYLKSIPLPDEGLRYGDYLVARMTWMPAALVENAYMILPRQEELLNSPAFQEELAAAMAAGILELFHVPPRPAKGKR